MLQQEARCACAQQRRGRCVLAVLRPERLRTAGQGSTDARRRARMSVWSARRAGRPGRTARGEQGSGRGSERGVEQHLMGAEPLRRSSSALHAGTSDTSASTDRSSSERAPRVSDEASEHTRELASSKPASSASTLGCRGRATGRPGRCRGRRRSARARSASAVHAARTRSSRSAGQGRAGATARRASAPRQRTPPGIDTRSG